jgi:hypothetical protein
VVKKEVRASPAVVTGPSQQQRVRPAYADQEKQKLSDAGACFYCKEQGHIARNCPRKPRAVAAVVAEPAKAQVEELSSENDEL